MELTGKEMVILEVALGTLLDNFMYQEEDYADLFTSEQAIRDLSVKIFRIKMEMEKNVTK
jgi:hypothetical protein